MKKLLFLLFFFLTVRCFALTEIQITSLNRNINGYIELTYKMQFALPTAFGTTQVPISGLSVIAASYSDGFTLIQDTTTSPASYYIGYSKTVSITTSTTLAQIETKLQNIYTAIRTKLDGLTLAPYDSIAGLSWDGTSWH